MSHEDHCLRDFPLSDSRGPECSRRIPNSEAERVALQESSPLHQYQFFFLQHSPPFLDIHLAIAKSTYRKTKWALGNKSICIVLREGKRKAKAILENPTKWVTSNFFELQEFALDSTPNFLFWAKGSFTLKHKMSLGRGARPPQLIVRLKLSCPSTEGFKGQMWSNLLNHQMFAIIRKTSWAVTISLFSSIQSQREFT